MTQPPLLSAVNQSAIGWVDAPITRVAADSISVPAVSATKVTVVGGTLTANAPVVDADVTWDDDGEDITFVGIEMNVTDTSSATASLLMDLQVGGSSKCKVSKAGLLTLGSGIVCSPAASATPASNGQMVFEFTNDTTLTVKCKGSDGTVRSVALTLA